MTMTKSRTWIEQARTPWLFDKGGRFDASDIKPLRRIAARYDNVGKYETARDIRYVIHYLITGDSE